MHLDGTSIIASTPSVWKLGQNVETQTRQLGAESEPWTIVL